MKTGCTAPDGTVKAIGDVVYEELSDKYIIVSRILNFKNYGSNSSRTRTVVIGVSKDIAEYVAPIELYPTYVEERTLRDVIGDMPKLEWGEICPTDFYHSFRTYPEEMRCWIHDLKQGQSAFDNEDELKRPHKIVDGVVVPNKQKNGDKYTRQYWDKVAPCIHTRNDQLASQNTVHPEEDRVFSIRELMKIMTIPPEFKWIDKTLEELNALPEKNKVPENMTKWVEEQILDMGLEMEGFAALDDSKTAITQSFTNQNARFYIAGIRGEEQDRDNKVHWFSMSSLESYLDMQRKGGKDGIHSSILTLYPMEQLRNKYKMQIQNMKPTEFKLDQELPKLQLVDKKVTNPSYRFNIVEASYINPKDGEVKTATYLTSRSNAANSILMTQDNQNMFLSPQQRSPYLTEGEEIKTEVAGGLTEGKTYEKTAFAELSEEQGFKADSIEEFTGPLAATPLNSELSKAYMAKYEQGVEGKQNLDEQEKIGQKRAIPFKTLKENLSNSKIPLTTKYYIMLKSRDLEKQKEAKEQEER